MARNSQRAGAAAWILSLSVCISLTGCIGGRWDGGGGTTYAGGGWNRPGALRGGGGCSECAARGNACGSQGCAANGCGPQAGGAHTCGPQGCGPQGCSPQAGAAQGGLQRCGANFGPGAAPNVAGGPGIPGGPLAPIPQGPDGPGPIPIEKQMTSLPPHRVAPPDVLLINLVRMVPRPPYRVEPLEILAINVTDTLPNQPIGGFFTVSPEGTINLGYSYGSLRVAGMTIDEVQNAIRRHLTNTLRNPQANVALAQFRGMEQIRGEHLVRPDGTVSLGSYGSVYVAGLSLGQAKCVIEEHLSRYMLNPQISLDVLAYNSRVYYIILDGAGYGQQVFRMPSTGNETILDALGNINGIAPVSSQRRVWLARPSPVHLGCNQVLPVDWEAIVKGGSTATNYQVLPGDRIYVDSNPLILFNNRLQQVLAPVNQVFGTLFLGSAAANNFRGINNQ